MNFDVYCDESHPDAFSTQAAGPHHLVIGSLWLPTADRTRRKTELHAIKKAGLIGGELKWRGVSRSRMSAYQEVLRWFWEAGDSLRFRAIVVDRRKLDLARFHENDAELGFYKFYYQLLQQWLLDYNTYAIFCDHKPNRMADRLPVLKRCLGASNISSEVVNLQAVHSKESVLIQVVDLFTGAVAARYNGTLRKDSVKAELVQAIEAKLGRSISHTPKAEQKFNVFAINPGGGW
jgi:hypothetical protein